MFQTRFVEKIKAHMLCSLTYFENCAVYKIMWHCDAITFYAGYLRLQTDTQNMWYLLLCFPATMVARTPLVLLHYTYISSLVIPLI
jgi:hypothetical protein